MSPRTPLFQPGEYFGHDDRPSLSRATIVVVVNAVLTSVFLWWFFTSIIGSLSFPPSVASKMHGIVSNTALSSFFDVFISWFILSIVLHVVVWFASGERGFGTTVAVVGITELVSLVLLPLTIAGFFLWIGDVPVTPTTEQSVQYLQTIASTRSPLLLGILLVGGFWKAYLQAVGLSCLHEISYGKIAVVTFVIAILGILGSLL